MLSFQPANSTRVSYRTGVIICWRLTARLERKAPMMFLYSIDVLTAYREKGLGKRLIEELKSICAERGFMKMYVITGEGNEAAMSLYKSAGGTRSAEDDTVFVWEFSS
jgi:ribosomal protein S18 acetylase RimI-like enzyme